MTGSEGSDAESERKLRCALLPTKPLWPRIDLKPNNNNGMDAVTEIPLLLQIVKNRGATSSQPHPGTCRESEAERFALGHFLEAGRAAGPPELAKVGRSGSWWAPVVRCGMILGAIVVEPWVATGSLCRRHLARRSSAAAEEPQAGNNWLPGDPPQFPEGDTVTA